MKKIVHRNNFLIIVYFILCARAFCAEIEYVQASTEIYTGSDIVFSITSSVSTALPCQAIVISVTIENQLPVELRYSESGFCCDYAFSGNRIEKNEMKPVELTSFGKRYMNNNESSRTIPRVLPPGYKVENQILINCFFDMSRPGDYRITLSRHFINPWKDNSRLLVSSNEIVVTIENNSVLEAGKDIVRNSTGEIMTPSFFVPDSLKESIHANNK